MSLEQALNDNTAAIKELALIMGGLKLPDVEAPPTDTKEVKKADAKKSTTSPTADASKTQTGPAETTTTADPAKDATEDIKAVTYDDAKAAITAVVKKDGRDGGLAVLALFKVASLLEVPEEKWGEVIDACNAKLAEKDLT